MISHIQTFAQLRREVRQALREQHPEWLDADGNSFMLSVYDARFAELLANLPNRESRPPNPFAA